MAHRPAIPEALSGRSRDWTVLALGGLVVLLIFALSGLRSHGEAITAAALIRTALPFALAWYGLAPLLGAFRPEVSRRPGQAWRRVLPVWLLCGGLALAGRSWWLGRPLLSGFAPVSLGTIGALLVIWRTGFALWKRRTSPTSR